MVQITLSGMLDLGPQKWCLEAAQTDQLCGAYPTNWVCILLGQVHIMSYALQNAFSYEGFRLGPRQEVHRALLEVCAAKTQEYLPVVPQHSDLNAGVLGRRLVLWFNKSNMKCSFLNHCEGMQVCTARM